MKLALSWLGWDIVSVELMRRQTHRNESVVVHLEGDAEHTEPEPFNFGFHASI